MPRRTIVQVRASRWELEWAATYLDGYDGRSLFFPAGQPEKRERAQDVAARLRTAARRQRRRFDATVSLSREHAELLASLPLVSGAVIKSYLPREVASLVLQCRARIHGAPIGRPRLNLGGVAERVEGAHSVDERHRRRLRNRLRYETELLSRPPASLFAFAAPKKP